MSFEQYPIVSQGQNTDIIRQGHNILTAKVGNLTGLITNNKISVVDAINSLQNSFDTLTASAYPPLANEQWLVALNAVGDGNINLFKFSIDNELILGRSFIPFSSSIDLGKESNPYRALYSVLIQTDKIKSLSDEDLLTIEINDKTILLESIDATNTLISVDSNLEIKSDHTKITSNDKSFELDPTTGALLPGVSGSQDLGSSDKRIDDVFATNLNLTGSITVPSGVGLPIGSGTIWFGPDNQVPSNYLIAKGDVVLRATYPTLFGLIGTTYNIGGEAGTEFRLPDMRGRLPFGIDTSYVPGDTINKKFGSVNHNHSIPAHRHNIDAVAISSSGPHTHPLSSCSGSNISFEHVHSASHSHAHTLSLSDNAHHHGFQNATIEGSVANISGSILVGDGSSADFPTGNVVQGLNQNNGSVTSGWRTNPLSLTQSVHNHTISGTVGIDTHNHTILGGISTASFNTGGPASNNATTMNGHQHSISSSGSHAHTVPAHWSKPTGTSGDAAMTSGDNNPPCIALWFIIKVL